jgi:uncharacterized membrane protein
MNMPVGWALTYVMYIIGGYDARREVAFIKT